MISRLVRTRSLLLIAAATAAACSTGAGRGDPPQRFTAEGLAAHVQVLSADEFEGRRSATPGGEKTVAYLEQAFREIGLKPGAGNSYQQPVPFVELGTQPSSSLEVSSPGGKLAFSYGPQAVYWTTRVTPEAGIEGSELVFVGYGIVDPSRDWNDYAGLDMRGKTAVILVNDPGFATSDPALFKGRTMTYFGRWTYKFDEAARQGAAGAIIVHEDEAAAYPWAVVQNGASRPQLVLDRPDGNASRVALEGWITLDSARKLFAAAGMDYEALKTRAAERGFQAVPMGLHASASVQNSIRRAVSSNVIGLLEGSERPDEYLVVTAHWDHLGIAERGEGDDRIFNGAVDNATGTGGMLELARAFAALEPRPERSILFVGFTGEEDGLLGSEYFADHPPVPVAQIVGGINIDAMIVYGRTRDVSVVGFGSSELEDYLRQAAARQGRVLRQEPTPEKGFYFRSDHFPLARKGVPMLYAKGGVDSVAHGPEWGRARQQDYIANRYHKPSDEYDPDWDLSGAIEDLEMYFDVLQQLAGETRFPEWLPGNEFRPIREQSRSGAGTGR
jgi:Zn-dependent M28 family amino/carboxypeptidase